MDTDAPRWSRAEEFYGHLGIPVPAPLTGAELAEWRRLNDDADRRAAELYGLDDAAAA